MYQSFRVQNFRCFEDLQLDDLARVNLLAGRNNTGKTSLLEALAIYSGNLSQEILFRVAIGEEKSLIPIPYEKSLPEWDTLFCGFNTNCRINFSEVIDAENSKSVSFKVELFDSGKYMDDLMKAGEILRGLDDIHGKPVLSVNFQGKNYYGYQQNGKLYWDNYISGSIPAIFLPSRKPISSHDEIKRFSNLVMKRKIQWILPIFQLIEPRLTDLQILTFSEFPDIYGDIGLEKPLKLISMGEGVQRIVNLVLAIGSASGGVVLIDEFENGLHYSVQKDVWKAIGKAAREFDVQIFATTHSLECVNAAHEAFSEEAPDAEDYDFRYYRLDRVKDGKIKVETFNRKDMNIVKDARLGNTLMAWKEPPKVEKSSLLLVEGRDEEFFFRALLKHMGIRDIQIISAGGKYTFKDNIGILVKLPSFHEVESIGIVRDVDDNREDAFKSITDSLKAAKLPVPEKALIPYGSEPQVMVMIMPPEPVGTGRNLEDLCMAAVKDEAAMKCVEQYFDCLKEQGIEHEENRIAKAQVHAFLASRGEPDKRLGEAAQAKYWNFDAPVYEPVKAFLRQVVRLIPPE